MAKSEHEIRELWAQAGGTVINGQAVMSEAGMLALIASITKVPAAGMLVEPRRIEAGVPDLPSKVWRAAQRLAGMLEEHTEAGNEPNRH